MYFQFLINQIMPLMEIFNIKIFLMKKNVLKNIMNKFIKILKN